MTSAMSAPATAVLTNAPAVSQGPSQAPRPAMSLTSPAPMPPIA